MKLKLWGSHCRLPLPNNNFELEVGQQWPVWNWWARANFKLAGNGQFEVGQQWTIWNRLAKANSKSWLAKNNLEIGQQVHTRWHVDNFDHPWGVVKISPANLR